MNNNLKSLAQIAAELQLTKQAVYKRVNHSPDVLERLQAHTVTNGKRKYYTVHGQKIIKDLFPLRQSQLSLIDFESSEPETTTENSESTAKATEGSEQTATTVSQGQTTEVNTEQPAIAALEKQLEVLQYQLTVKDEQIKELQAALRTAQEQQSALTTVLSQQQALHAGTIQQQLTTEQQQSEHDLPTAPEGQEEQPAPKQSLFKRLFGKRNEKEVKEK